MTKATRAQYRLEFKQEAVRMVESGQSIAQPSQLQTFSGFFALIFVVKRCVFIVAL
jgi:hypothetical protein